MKICIGSHFNTHLATYNGLLFDAATAMADASDATVIAPARLPQGAARRFVSRARNRLRSVPLPQGQVEDAPGSFDLFLYVAMTPWDLLEAQALSRIRERSKKSAIFLYEFYSAEAEEMARPFRLLDDFDHVFIGNHLSVPVLQRYTSTPASYVPAAADCLLATPYPNPGSRPIDVFGMGRGVSSVHAQLVELTLRNRLFYHWELHGWNMPPNGYAEARQRTYHLIRNSRFLTCFGYHAQTGKSQQSKGEAAIPTRVFEGTASGAVLFGSAPRTDEWHRLFDWDDALVEIPLDPVDVAAAYEEVDAQPERFRRAGVRNAAGALRKHDWAYRLETMLETLDLPVPPAMSDRKSRLAALAADAESRLRA